MQGRRVMHNNIKQPKTKTNHALNLTVADAIKSVKCCLVPRPQYYASVIRFGSRGPGRKVWPRRKSEK